MKLWLDDIRPAPPGWHHVKTIREAKDVLMTGLVTHASLDHDLGACEDCMAGRTAEQWLAEHNNQAMPNCTHFGTGYDLVTWMEETHMWPSESIMCHSRNPVGRARMQQVMMKEVPRQYHLGHA